jgi:choline kinase
MKTTRRPKPLKAVILAAGVGSRIRPLTDDCPKTLLQVAGIPILERMIVNIRACGITEVIVVLGYLDARIESFVRTTFPDLSARFIVNDKYAETNTGYSLMLAEHAVNGSGFVKFDADVVFDPQILRQLIESDEENCLCVDQNIQLDAEEVKVVVDGDFRVLQASKSVDPKAAAGESIGIEKISPKTGQALFAELCLMMAQKANHQEYYEAAYERLMANAFPFHALDITGLDWVEIDTFDDFTAANWVFGNRTHGDQRFGTPLTTQPAATF